MKLTRNYNFLSEEMLPRLAFFKNEKNVSVFCDKHSSCISGVTLKKMRRLREFSAEQIYNLLFDTKNSIEVTGLVYTQYHEHFVHFPLYCV